MADNKDTKKKAQIPAGHGEHQTDLAEGERDTVEESIREHEEKGDLEGQKPKP
jgi:hypothetical protein